MPRYQAGWSDRHDLARADASAASPSNPYDQAKPLQVDPDGIDRSADQLCCVHTDRGRPGGCASLRGAVAGLERSEDGDCGQRNDDDC
jgi:hypothetical protein